MAQPSSRFHDPATGDPLSALEYGTRQIQQALRSPWFLLAFNLSTLILFLLGLREQWNYFASWLAIMVEWVVGTYMFGQTRRDAIILRQLLATATRLEALEQTAATTESRILDTLSDPEETPPHG